MTNFEVMKTIGNLARLLKITPNDALDLNIFEIRALQLSAPEVDLDG